MPDTTNQIKVSGLEIENTTVFPDSKLQTLDRRVGKENLYFGKEWFAESIDKWNGIPIIYHPNGVHPQGKMFEAVELDPEKAAEAIGGKYVGEVSNAHIVIQGGARLMAALNIHENETEIVDLWNQGLLFPSTAFTCDTDGDRIVSPPIPNHVLLFPIKVDEVVPGDFGAYVNTFEVTKMKKEDKKPTPAVEGTDSLNSEVQDAPTVEEPQVNAEQEDELAKLTEEIGKKDAEIEALKAEIEALKASTPADETPVEETQAEEIPVDDEMKAKDDEIASLKLEIDALRRELEAIKMKEMEDEFHTLLHSLPSGMTATDAQKKELHDKFFAGDTKSLLFSVLESVKGGETKKTGVPFTQSENVVPQTNSGIGDLATKKINAKREKKGC